MGAPTPGAPGRSPLREDERREATRLDAVGRAALLLPLLVLSLGASDRPELLAGLLAIRALVAGIELGLALGPAGRRVPPLVGHLLDAATLTGLLLVTGASSSPLLPALLLMPVAVGASGSWRNAVALGAVSSCAYVLALLGDVLAGEALDARDVLSALGALAGASAGGYAVARVSQPLVVRAARTRSGTRLLLSAGLNLEDRERRRISQQLHEGPLQSVLAARQEVDEHDQAALIHARRDVEDACAGTRLAADALDPAPGSAVDLQERLRAALERPASGSVRVLAGSLVPEEDQEVLLDLALRLGDVLESHAPADAVTTARVEVDETRTSLWVDAPGDLGLLRRGTGALAEHATTLGCGVLLGAGGPGRSIVQLRLNGRADRATLAADAVGRREARAAADVRLALFVAAAAWVLLRSGTPSPGAFAALVTCLALAVAGAALAHSAAWRAYPVRGASGWGLAVTALAVACFGGSSTPLVAYLPLLPFALVWALGRRDALRLCGGLVGAYALGALAARLVDGVALDAGAAGRFLVLMAWATGMVAAVGLARDRLEEQTVVAEAERRALLAESLAGAGAERTRLAGALRDGALAWLEHAGRELAAALPRPAPERLGPIRAAATALGQATGALRAVADELHPPALEHGGLRAAIVGDVAPLASDEGLDVIVRVDEAIDPRHHELVIALLRELVLNVRRHAAASRVSVDVHRGATGLDLEVVDDGRGMAPDRPAAALAEGRRGLAVSRERVEAAGGWLRLTSAPNRGTTVTVRLPGAPPLVGAPSRLSQVG